jgi:hypothetical protein
MLTATCHCGKVKITVPRRPRTLTDCNCSICRRYGTLWAYYKADTVHFEGMRGSTDGYVWGNCALRFVRCTRCGCVTHWEAAKRGSGRRVGVNARNFEPGALEGVRIRRLDGAASWKYFEPQVIPSGATSPSWTVVAHVER